MIRKLKITIKSVVYYIVDVLVQPSKKIQKNTILLIRLDAIGDYVLFRNFIKLLKENDRYKCCKITLLGNKIWKDLAQNLDSQYISNFIWIDRKKFNKNIIYRYKKLQEILSNGYEIVLSPVYSREFFYEDTIVRLINAREKIGSLGDLSNIEKWQKKIGDKFYTRLIAAKKEITFEFYRNKEFFENFLSTVLSIRKPYINLKSWQTSVELPEKYAILFIGASSSLRKWDIGRFARVGECLKAEYGYDIVLCGAQSDVEDAIEFSREFSGNYINLVGKTSLMDLLYIVRSGSFLLSNETSVPHFAVALGIKNILVVYNGNHYGRFTPYPEEICENYYVVYHPKIEDNLDDYKKLSNEYGFGSSLDINDISSERVIDVLNNILGGKK